MKNIKGSFTYVGSRLALYQTPNGTVLGHLKEVKVTLTKPKRDWVKVGNGWVRGECLTEVAK